MRESVAIGLLDDGYTYKYDVSLPLDCYYDIVEVMRKRLEGVTTTVCGYGHVGDGEHCPSIVKLGCGNSYYDIRTNKDYPSNRWCE